jgi:hypothetical protein
MAKRYGHFSLNDLRGAVESISGDGIDTGSMVFSPVSKDRSVGLALLIATCLIVAIRTAKWPAQCDTSLSGAGLNDEIYFAANVASRVMTTLIGKYESIFPSAKKPWCTATEDEDVPK